MSDGFWADTDRFLLLWGTPAETDPPVDLTSDVPRLREQTSYDILLRSTDEEPIALLHRDPVLCRGLRSGDGGRVVYGSINFGSQIGGSTFHVQPGDGPAMPFSVEVVPTKLDYAEDYLRITADTQDLALALVLEYLRSTFQLGTPTSSPESTQLEWLLLLRHAAGELERALNHIARNPHWGLLRKAEPTRAERVRRADAALRRALERGAGSGEAWMTNGGAALRANIPECRPRPTLDTPEHRWLAAQVRRVRRQLARVAGELRRQGSGSRQVRTLEEVVRLEERFARMAALPPLAQAAGDPPPGWLSLQLGSAPGYQDAYHACRILRLGLRLRGGPVHLAVRDLHQLYEQWCFLALVRLVALQIGEFLPASQLVEAEEQGLRLALRRGWEHSVRFSLPQGQHIVLIYNPRFGGERFLVPQRPDIVLQVQSPGGKLQRWVLDAKYRIDPSAEYRRRFGSPGPPEDALNGLHRYRDALGVAQAIALFPYREAQPGEFRSSRLWRSIGQIGVGALPLLPGETSYAAEWLLAVLEM